MRNHNVSMPCTIHLPHPNQKTLRGLEEKIKKEIESVLGVFVRVKLVEPKTIERSEGKAKRVIDKRVL